MEGGNLYRPVHGAVLYQLLQYDTGILRKYDPYRHHRYSTTDCVSHPAVYEECTVVLPVNGGVLCRTQCQFVQSLPDCHDYGRSVLLTGICRGDRLETVGGIYPDVTASGSYGNGGHYEAQARILHTAWCHAGDCCGINSACLAAQKQAGACKQWLPAVAAGRICDSGRSLVPEAKWRLRLCLLLPKQFAR